MAALKVVVDGVVLGESEARAFWQRFSAWMDDHVGDLSGFARSEDLASVHPEVHDGTPALVASRTAPQQAYRTATTRKAPDAGRPPPARGKRRP